MGSALSMHDLNNLSDDELVNLYDEQARRTGIGIDHYLDELNRRHQERQTDSMLRFTRSITVMTIAITVATLINVALSALIVWL